VLVSVCNELGIAVGMHPETVNIKIRIKTKIVLLISAFKQIFM